MDSDKNKNRIELKNQIWFDKANTFSIHYKREQILWGKNKTILVDSIKDKCRFCLESFPSVTFKQETHVISQQFNRSKPISKFECDICNRLFSKYESDFGHYLLFERSIFGHRKKKSGFTKFKTEKGSEFKRIADFESIKSKFGLSEEVIEKLEKDEIRAIDIFTSAEDQDFSISQIGNKFKFELIRPPYRPINVLKTFLKIGLSMIKEPEIEKYSRILNFIKEDNIDPGSFTKKLYTYTIPVLENYYPYPVLDLYNLKESKENFYDKTLIIYFGNRIYQVQIPSNTDIKRIEKSELAIESLTISPYINPHILSRELNPSKNFLDNLERAKFDEIDLSNLEILRNELFYEELEIDENIKY